MTTSKPCIVCEQPASLTCGDKFFDPEWVFSAWASVNRIICPDRSRFDGIRNYLAWAADDESDDGAHAFCALKHAIQYETGDGECVGFSTRYPIIPSEEDLSGPPPGDEFIGPLPPRPQGVIGSYGSIVGSKDPADDKVWTEAHCLHCGAHHREDGFGGEEIRVFTAAHMPCTREI